MADKRLTAGQRRTDQAIKDIAGGRPSLWAKDPPERIGRTRASDLAKHPGARWADILAIVVGSGMGLTISGTRDGGALALSLLTEDGPLKRYGADPGELDALLEDLKDTLGDQL